MRGLHIYVGRIMMPPIRVSLFKAKRGMHHMKWLGIGLFWMVCAGLVQAESPVEAEVDAPTGIAIAAIGELSDAHMERVRAFVQRNTSIATRLLEPQSASGEDFSEILDTLAPLRTSEHACIVFLYAGEDTFEEHTVYRYESGVGVVNAALMQTEDEERYLRRLEKLTMRSVGLLLGVEMVPNPHSAMWSYRTMSDLDAMGRNYDPPSLMRLHDRARAMGIPLIERQPPRVE